MIAVPACFFDMTKTGQWLAKLENTTHLSIIVLKSRTPAMSLAANLNKMKGSELSCLTCNINSYETAELSTTAFELNDITFSVIDIFPVSVYHLICPCLSLKFIQGKTKPGLE